MFCKFSVHSLTADVIQASKYKLFAVALPVPGNSVVLPNNDLQKRCVYYSGILA